MLFERKLNSFRRNWNIEGFLLVTWDTKDGVETDGGKNKTSSKWVMSNESRTKRRVVRAIESDRRRKSAAKRVIYNGRKWNKTANKGVRRMRCTKSENMWNFYKRVKNENEHAGQCAKKHARKRSFSRAKLNFSIIFMFDSQSKQLMLCHLSWRFICYAQVHYTLRTHLIAFRSQINILILKLALFRVHYHFVPFLLQFIVVLVWMQTRGTKCVRWFVQFLRK